jgi:hypothetical protein
VASQAVDACASDVVAHLKAEPACGFKDFGPTAWDEAVGILSADEHLMAETVHEDLASAAYAALERLPRAERIAAWLDTHDDELRDETDLLDGEVNLDRFEPLDAWTGSADKLVKRVVRSVARIIRAT